MISLRPARFARAGAAAAAAITLALLVSSSTAPGIALAIPAPVVAAALSAQTPTVTTPPDGYQGFDPATSDIVDSDEYSDTFLNADGTFTDVISIEPINVEHGDDWVPASDAITHDASGWSAEDHPLSPEFANSANGALTASHGGSQISFRLEGADHAVIERVPGTTDAVEYENAIDNADLRYDTDGAAVKETLVLNEAPGESSWTWRIHAPGLNLTKNEIGDLQFVDSDGTVQFHIPAPVAWDSSGVDGVREPALIGLQTSITTTGEEYKLTLSADPQWLSSDARVYPVYVDPSVTAGDTNFHAYKSDGAVRTDAVHVGNTRELNTNKYWRTQSKYAYSGLAGKQVIDANFKAVYVSGTANAYTGGGIYEAPCFGYSCYGTKLASVTVGSTYGNFNTDGLATYYALAVDAANYDRYLTTRGAETAGVFTYKQLDTALTLTYKEFPSITGLNGASPANGANTTINTSLSVATVAPTGVQIFTRYLVSLTPSFTEETATYVSDWAAPGAIDLADTMGLAPGTTYYWKAQVKDTYDGLYGVSTVRTSPTWSFVTVDAAPDVPSIAGIRPATDEGSQLLVGVAPTIGVYSSDADSSELQATVEVFADDGFGAPTSLVDGCSSEFGVQPGVLSCALGEDALADGLTYHLRARAFDGNAYSGWSPWTTATASNVVVEDLPDFTEKSLDFDHAVSLDDAIAVMDQLSYQVVGYEYDNEDLMGAYYPSADYIPADFLAGFAADYDTVPEITAVVVLAPTVAAVSTRLGGSTEDPTISTGKPIVNAPLADGIAVREFDTAMDEVAAEQASSDGGTAAMVAVPSGFTNWRPDTVRTNITKAGTSVAKKVKFDNYYYWNGKTSSPKRLNDYKQYWPNGDLYNYFGLEFENNVWGSHYDAKKVRCQVGIWCTFNQCDVPESRKYLVAYNQGFSVTVRYGEAGTIHDADFKSLGVYKDTNDVWDSCNKNSIAVGIQHPEDLPVTSSTDKAIRLYISVTTTKGTDNFDKISAGIQPVTGAACINNTAQTWTDCMGAVPDGVYIFPDAYGYRNALGIGHAWTAPSLCWKSDGYGDKNTPVVRIYSPCAVAPVPW